MNNKKVGGVVVLYYPEVEVIENIKSYLNQIDTLLVFDNSGNYASEVVEWIKSNDKIIYKNDNNNYGIARALNYAANYFMELDFNYLLTLDQDSCASVDMVKSLLEITNDIDDIGIVSPFHTNRYNTKQPPAVAFQEVVNVKTSGNLVNLFLFPQIGEFNENYFIDYVDIEYGYRIKLKGFKVIQVNSVLLYHNEANIIQKRFLWWTLYPYNHNKKRMYYKTRNLLYLRDQYSKILHEELKAEIKEFRNNLFKIILFEKEKTAKIKMILMGYSDYLKKVTGRNPKE